MASFAFRFYQNSISDPAGGAYSAPPGPLAGGEGAGCPLPKNPTLASASFFGPWIRVPLTVLRTETLYLDL